MQGAPRQADDSYHIDADMCSLGSGMFRFSLEYFFIVICDPGTYERTCGRNIFTFLTCIKKNKVPSPGFPSLKKKGLSDTHR